MILEEVGQKTLVRLDVTEEHLASLSRDLRLCIEKAKALVLDAGCAGKVTRILLEVQRIPLPISPRLPVNGETKPVQEPPSTPITNEYMMEVVNNIRDNKGCRRF